MPYLSVAPNSVDFFKLTRFHIFVNDMYLRCMSVYLNLNLRGSGPVYFIDHCKSGHIGANRAVDEFGATLDAGHHVATGKEDGVDVVVKAHLALGILLRDLATLEKEHSPGSHPGLELDATELEHLLELLIGQLGQVELRDEVHLVHLDHQLPADRALGQLLSAQVASYKVTTVEEDRVDVFGHANL